MKPAKWYRDFKKRNNLPTPGVYSRDDISNSTCVLIWVVASLLAVMIVLCCGEAVAHEKNIVAKVIAAEACGEGEIGMRAVANVINNRSRQWRQPIVKVVTAKNQFYGYTASNRDRLYSQCKETADRLAANIKNLDDITGGALYFRQPSEPVYRWHGEETVRIKKHIFHLGK